MRLRAYVSQSTPAFKTALLLQTPKTSLRFVIITIMKVIIDINYVNSKQFQKSATTSKENNPKHYLCFAKVLDECDHHSDHNLEFFLENGCGARGGEQVPGAGREFDRATHGPQSSKGGV